jgi:hypothetical protein
LLAAAEISGDALPGLTAKEDDQLGAGGFRLQPRASKKQFGQPNRLAVFLLGAAGNGLPAAGWYSSFVVLTGLLVLLF